MCSGKMKKAKPSSNERTINYYVKGELKAEVCLFFCFLLNTWMLNRLWGLHNCCCICDRSVMIEAGLINMLRYLHDMSRYYYLFFFFSYMRRSCFLPLRKCPAFLMLHTGCLIYVPIIYFSVLINLWQGK